MTSDVDLSRLRGERDCVVKELRCRRDVALLLRDRGYREERRGHRSVHVAHANRAQLLPDLQRAIAERRQHQQRAEDQLLEDAARTAEEAAR